MMEAALVLNDENKEELKLQMAEIREYSLLKLRRYERYEEECKLDKSYSSKI